MTEQSVNWLMSEKKDKNTEVNGVSLIFLDQEKMPSLEDILSQRYFIHSLEYYHTFLHNLF